MPRLFKGVARHTLLQNPYPFPAPLLPSPRISFEFKVTLLLLILFGVVLRSGYGRGRTEWPKFSSRPTNRPWPPFIPTL